MESLGQLFEFLICGVAGVPWVSWYLGLGRCFRRFEIFGVKKPNYLIVTRDRIALCQVVE